jgi:CRISPR-associated endonuclease/helicase Cas3
VRGHPTTFWGKLKQDAGIVVEWHPMPAHCADVAACVEALLQRTLLRRRLAALAGREDLDDVTVARLSALAALHDIGKFNLGFQRKADAEPRDTAGHVAEALALFTTDYSERQQLFAALPAQDVEAWATDGVGFELLVAAIGHHGRPVRCGERPVDRSIWRAERHLDPFAGIAALTASVRSWFPAAFAPASRPLPDTAGFQHAFAGLVMLGDWLGSDTQFFPFADGLGDRMPFARDAALKAVRAIGLDVGTARTSLGDALPGFDRISAFQPREAQARTMALSRPAAGSLTILESETGSGKTEAALGRFIQLFHGGLVDGMVFALPTRTAATQLHGRVREAIERAFSDREARPPVVLAVPGYLQVDDVSGRRLPGFEVLWNDDDKERARHRGWAAEQPKRYLAGAVVVGTIDQVLLSSLRVGHAHLRSTALLRHLLVVDEVHASDAYMNRILAEVLRFHLAAGGHAFLMSATLGTDVRRRLEVAALGPSRSDPSTAGSLEAALRTPYPVVHHAPRGGQPALNAVGNPGLPKTIQVSLESISDDPEVVAARAIEAARRGARVIVLRNTVADAVATQLALEQFAGASNRGLLFGVGEIATLHHARFSRPDRERLDREIEARFGKQAPARGGVVAVATQTVQQSLDLDADVMFTDLAPMDVLLQRFGRVHRHRTRDPDRPEGFEAPRAIVMTGEDPLEASLRESGEARGAHGVGTVYDDVLILEATRRRIATNGALSIPEHNRELVEVTTHPEAIDTLARELGGRWQKHWNKVFGVERAHVGLADLNLVDRTQHFGEYTFKRTDLEERIAARLGESDRRATFAEPPLGPFGGKVRELNIPGWLARKAPADPDLAPTEVVAGAGAWGASVRFAFGPLRFVYDRLGLRRDETPSTDPSEDLADA